jgi:YbbR domain-containing protein
LAASILLFFVFSLNRLVEQHITVPLAISYNEGFLPANPLPRTVRVIMRGEAASLRAIRDDDISASLDLTTFRTESVQRVAVTIERRGEAASADPLEIHVEPPEIAVSIERKAKKTIPVTPSFRGFLEQGYELVSYAIDPAQVDILGPAGTVARTADLPTDFIDLAGHNADFSIRAKLLKKEGINLASGQDSVEFRAIVRKSIPVKQLNDLPIEVQGLSPRFVLTGQPDPGSARIRLRGVSGEDASSLRVHLTVDAQSISRAGSHSLPVAIRVPEGYVAETYEPLTVTLKVVEPKEGQP